MIGVAPYQSRPYSDTKTLCDYLLACMQADDDVDVDIAIYEAFGYSGMLPNPYY